jgi:tRNA nucleotidyltransferase/poly(A) polymerase
LDFDIETKTKKAAIKLSPNIKGLSIERVREELLKSAAQSGEKFANYIETLAELKILKHILPEIMNLKWFRENLHHHPETRGHGGTVYSHVMAALKKSDTKNPIKNLAILLHDVGKGVTFAPQKTHGTPTYYRHAEKSIKLVGAIADRLKLSNKDRDAIIFAVGNHMKFHMILDMKPAKVAKLVNSDHWDVLTAVGKADEYARGEAFMKAGSFEKIIDKAIKIKEKYGTKEVGKRLKLVDGKHVMAITGMKPGKPLGDVVRKTTEWIMNNDVSDKEKIDDYIRSIAP